LHVKCGKAQLPLIRNNDKVDSHNVSAATAQILRSTDRVTMRLIRTITTLIVTAGTMFTTLSYHDDTATATIHKVHV